MKTLIICISMHHGNTEKIAKAMAEFLDAKLVKPHEVNTTTLSKYDLIGFGSGIYFFKHHRALLNLVDEMPRAENKKAFVFSTRGIGLVWFYHRPLEKKLKEKGFDIVGGFSCRGFDTYLFDKYIHLLKFTGGLNKERPNEKDLENAKNFTQDLLKKLSEAHGN